MKTRRKYKLAAQVPKCYYCRFGNNPFVWEPGEIGHICECEKIIEAWLNGNFEDGPQLNTLEGNHETT